MRSPLSESGGRAEQARQRKALTNFTQEPPFVVDELVQSILDKQNLLHLGVLVAPCNVLVIENQAQIITRLHRPRLPDFKI